ncbi:hypothetical protein [Rubricoccus marinus]|uniref:Orc1-like AAA ATPase domain-containing protein n=1 Tax=Rubricoccus marinus TaxID=716817 RepID=A0A259TUY0_9BACT|nr:hypothetical protein [Rubricoccus marinus]OZC01384.1 hypothetical protein BSZ36_16990 [Rubricoccus marinus]
MPATTAPRTRSIARSPLAEGAAVGFGPGAARLRPQGVPGAPDCTVLTDPIRFGHGELLAELAERTKVGRHTLLIGAEGIGKTRILEDLAAVVAGHKVLLDPAEQKTVRRRYVTMPQKRGEAYTLVYVAEAGPHGRLVDSLAEAFHELGILALPGIPLPMRAAACAEYAWAEVKKLLRTVADRQEAVVASLHDLAGGGRAPRLVVVIDALDRATPSQGLFLREIQQRATIVGAIRSIPPSRSMRMFFATFGQIRVRPLDPRHIAALFEYFLQRYGITCADVHHYRREVIRRAEGNPAAMRAMMHDGAQSKLVTSQDVRDLQARDDAPFFNLGLIYVFFLIGLGALRVLMIGVRNTDLYIILTLLTVLGYLIFRVYRVFFMFQPKPEAK